MTAATVPPEVGAYLEAVRAALSDLPDAERDDLLVEVETSLVETASETGTPIDVRLGPPDEFAAELRSAAGLEAARPAPVRSRMAGLVERAATWAVRDPRVSQLRRLAGELAPIWWVARAYLAVAAFALATDAGWSSLHPAVPRLGSSEAGVAGTLVATFASIALGLWGRRANPPARYLFVVGNVVLLLAALPVLGHLTDTSARDGTRVVTVSSPAIDDLANHGARVENIYPYSRGGRLLHDVLLYDEAGRPLEIGAGTLDPDRRVLQATGRTAIFNSFPIRYYEPGTRRVARPEAAPPIRTPQILTPPLRKRAQQR